MKRKIFLLTLLLWFIIIFANEAYGKAQSEGVVITGGDITLIISAATAGQQPNPATDENTGLQYWGKGNNIYKITVETNLPSPKFTLKVKAVNLTSSKKGGNPGNAPSEVTIGKTATPLITDITGGTHGNPHTCILRYTASATVEQGTGTDEHTIKYTITLQ